MSWLEKSVFEHRLDRQLADERTGVGEEGVRHVMSVFGDERVGHRPRLLRDGLERHHVEGNRVFPPLLAPYRNRAALPLAGGGGLEGGDAGLARLFLVDDGRDAGERALEIAEGVGADALDLRLLLDEAGEGVAGVIPFMFSQILSRYTKFMVRSRLTLAMTMAMT